MNYNHPKRETMRSVKANGHQALTLLEGVLRLQGDFRKRLTPLGVTPLQGGTLLYLSRHKGATVKATAAFFHLRAPTMVYVIQDLARKGWLTKRQSQEHHKALSLNLTPQGKVVAGRIKDHIRQVRSKITPKKET